jgi:hypothetical protein
MSDELWEIKETSESSKKRGRILRRYFHYKVPKERVCYHYWEGDEKATIKLNSIMQ